MRKLEGLGDLNHLMSHRESRIPKWIQKNFSKLARRIASARARVDHESHVNVRAQRNCLPPVTTDRCESDWNARGASRHRALRMREELTHQQVKHLRARATKSHAIRVKREP